MRRILAAALTLTALTGGAFAADFGRAPVYVPPPPAPAYVAPGWTGFYIGGHAGYGWGKASDSLDCGGPTVGSISVFSGSGPVCDVANNGNAFAFTALANQGGGAPWFTFDDLSGIKGWLAGGQIGYNKQLGPIVIGAEVSGSVSSLRDTALIGVDFNPGGGGVYTLESTVNWMTRAVGKLGFAVTNSVMIYADGGLALANFGLTSSAGYSDNTTAAGWTVGAAAEMKVSQHISLFARYDFSQIRNVAFEGQSVLPGGFTIDNVHEYDFNIHTTKIGFNYNID